MSKTVFRKKPLKTRKLPSISDFVLGLMLVVTVILTGYFYFKYKDTSKKVIVLAGRTKEFQLVKYPSDTKNPLKTEGTISTSFSKNETIGVEGSLQAPLSKSVTFQIVNNKGNEIQTGTLKVYSNKHTTIICCTTAPESQGEYLLRLFFSGEIEPLLPLIFNVSG